MAPVGSECPSAFCVLLSEAPVLGNLEWSSTSTEDTDLGGRAGDCFPFACLVPEPGDDQLHRCLTESKAPIWKARFAIQN